MEGRPYGLKTRRATQYQLYAGSENVAPLHPYYVFDLLAYRGKNLLQIPLEKRRELLCDFALARAADPIRFSPTFDAPAYELVTAAKRQKLESIIAKRLGSIYVPGERSDAWVKFRVNQGQELVIGGYMPGPNHFQLLLVGYYEGKKLLFLGKVKNGFVPAIKDQVFRRFAGAGNERLFFRQPAGAEDGPPWRSAYARGHEQMPLAETGASRSNRVH